MKTKPLTIGIIGTGFGKIIGLNFKAVDPDIKIYYSGRNKEKLENCVKEVGADGVFPTWQELIKDPKIDLVVIASYSAGHRQMYDLAVKYGKNVLVEKPAALRSIEVKEMDERQGELLAYVNHEGRFHPVIGYIKDLIDGKKLGNIMTVRVGSYLNWYSGEGYIETWNNYKETGGGQIYAVGTHQLDLANYLLGFPQIKNGSVQTAVYKDPRFKEPPTAESQFSAHYLTIDDTSIQVFNDCYCFGYKDFTIEVIGSKGIVMYSDQKGLRTSYGNSEPLGEVKWIDPMPEITLGNSILTRSMKYMVKALLELLESNKEDKRFCTLQEERVNLELFEKYKVS